MVLARIILGFLAIRPMSGYDIMRAFRTSAAHFWNADKAQIYRTLSRLVDDGLARTEVVPGTDAPDRIEHHITEAGRTALVDWLSSDPNHQAERDPFIARIFFSDSIGDDVLARVIETRRDAAVASLDELNDVRAQTPQPTPSADRGGWLRSMTLDHGIRATEMHIAWLDDLRSGLTVTSARERDQP